MSSNPEALPLTGVPLAVPLAAEQALAIDSVDPGRSVGWWEAAWWLFVRHPLRWMAMGAAMMVALGLAGLLPAVGLPVAALLSPVLVAGWMLAAQRARGGVAPGVRDLLGGFRAEHRRPLLTLGAALACSTLAMDWTGRLFGLGAMVGAVGIDAPSHPQAQAAISAGMLALLLMLVASLLVTAALWFAPALVVLRGSTPARAMRASLRAVLDNGLTFLLFAVVQLLLVASAASTPYHAGWLLLLPLMLHTGYLSYREVFES
jgi:hypothetical protein